MRNPILLDLPDFIDGERIRLRPPQAGDGAAIFEAVQESKAQLYPWLPWGDQHPTPEDSEAFARRSFANWHRREDLGVVITDKVTGRYLGGSGLHRINWNVPSCEIGYWIRSSEVGKGYVTETVRLLTDFAFDAIGAERVFIRCAVGNVRSRAIPERIGFISEGIYRNEIRLADDTVSDIVCYSVTPEDWRRLRSGR